jgi:hypothetical protein
MRAGPPSDAPNSTTRRLPAASSTAPMSCAVASTPGEPDPVGQPDAATIEQDETAHLSEGGQERPAPGLLPNPFDVGHEVGEHQNIKATGGVGLEREMDAAAADVAHDPCSLHPTLPTAQRHFLSSAKQQHSRVTAEGRHIASCTVGGSSIIACMAWFSQLAEAALCANRSALGGNRAQVGDVGLGPRTPLAAAR